MLTTDSRTAMDIDRNIDRWVADWRRQHSHRRIHAWQLIAAAWALVWILGVLS